jgi:L-cysteate sulfo-lyase
MARIELARLPTPLEPLERLTARLGGPRLYAKRDDETGLALGGNKLRKLEFLLGDALDLGADAIITCGAMQSNHARQTAAACAKLGLYCELVLRGRPTMTNAYVRSGNVLLDRLFGARLHFIEPDDSREDAMAGRAEALAGDGRKPYVIPMGGSNIVGCFGYAACAEELIHQCGERGFEPDYIVCATSSGGTHAGLVAGLHVIGSRARVVGIAVDGDSESHEENVYGLACEAARALGAKGLRRDRVSVLDDYAGPGYAEPTDGMRNAVKLAARLEGLVLDPVYTGKAMAGLVGLIDSGYFRADQHVVFLHTGGAPGLFGYPEALALD